MQNDDRKVVLDSVRTVATLAYGAVSKVSLGFQPPPGNGWELVVDVGPVRPPIVFEGGPTVEDAVRQFLEAATPAVSVEEFQRSERNRAQAFDKARVELDVIRNKVSTFPADGGEVERLRADLQACAAQRDTLAEQLKVAQAVVPVETVKPTVNVAGMTDAVLHGLIRNGKVWAADELVARLRWANDMLSRMQEQLNEMKRALLDALGEDIDLQLCREAVDALVALSVQLASAARYAAENGRPDQQLRAASVGCWALTSNLLSGVSPVLRALEAVTAIDVEGDPDDNPVVAARDRAREALTQLLEAARDASEKA